MYCLPVRTVYDGWQYRPGVPSTLPQPLNTMVLVVRWHVPGRIDPSPFNILHISFLSAIWLSLYGRVKSMAQGPLWLLLLSILFPPSAMIIVVNNMPVFVWRIIFHPLTATITTISVVVLVGLTFYPSQALELKGGNIVFCFQGHF